MARMLVLLLVLVIAVAVHADDGYISAYGGAIKLMKPEHASIRMIRERVWISITGMTASVTCVFTFRNEGRRADVMMGFPDHILNTGEEDYCPPGPMIRNFRSWLDGERTPVRYVAPRVVPSSVEHEYEGWYTKRVTFAAGQTRVVKDTYICGVPMSYCESSAWLTYILTTGASWKGKIGEAVISLDTSKMRRDFRRYRFSPAGYAHRGKVYRWVIRDFEPSEEVTLDFASSPRINDCPLYDDAGNSQIANGHIVTPVWNLDSFFDNCIVRSEWNSRSHCCIISITRTKSVKKTYGSKTKWVAKPLWHRQLRIVPGSRRAITDGTRVVWLRHTPEMHNDKIYVHLADVTRALGGYVGYLNDRMHIRLEFPENEPR